MITLKSNIEFLTNYNAWRRERNDENNHTMPSPSVIGLNIDAAIDYLNMLQDMIADAARAKLSMIEESENK